MLKFYLFVFLFFCSYSFAQNTIAIKGKILNNKTQSPLESATVYLTSVKDSSVIDYTISDKNGFFKMDTKKITKPVFLRISYMGYQSFKQEVTAIIENKDFGVLHLLENENLLSEVVIKSEAPPIRIKKDTLEFNASSFKVRPDANVETLLKQLPGVQIDADGKITVNGKEVNQVLVNGKPFFDKDGKIALQSLPSDIINKVQISDTKTKKEELTKQAASSNNASINLTIDEDKNKGFFGKFIGGYGTDDRYETSALINYFKNKRKISVLASSNNFNSTGFSMDEVFDNMGGGRNTSYFYNSDGSYGFGNMRFGGGKGITQSNMVGINYADEWFKSFESNGSYFFNNSNSENKNTTKQVNFLPIGDFITESMSKTNGESLGHNFNFIFEYKIDSTATIMVSPKFNNANNTYNSASSESSMDENNQLLNKNNSVNREDGESNNFKNVINFNKSFKRKGRFLNVNLENDNSNGTSDVINKSVTTFYQGSEPEDIRNQFRENQILKDIYSTEIEYLEPLKDSLKLKVGVYYRTEKLSDDRKAYDYDAISETYSIENGSLTNYLTSNTNLVTPKTGFAIEKKKYNIDLSVGTTIAQFNNYSLYLNETTHLNKKYVFPFVNANGNYKFSKSKSIYTRYEYEVNFPSASQVLPIENLANPLNTFIGNPSIGLFKSHTGFFSFRDFNTATRSGYSIHFGGDYFNNQVVSSVKYDANRKRTTTYENVSGTYTSWFGGNWNKAIKKEAHNYKFGFGLYGGFDFSKGFTDGELFDANAFRITPRVNFTYEYGELFTIEPSYNFTYNETKYTNYSISSASNVLHKLNIQTTNYWPKNWVFGNDFGYTFNSNIAKGFKKDFYLWNTSLAYSFYNKKMTFKVKVYDILNQNQSTTRTITPTAIRDEENTVLKRYAMFSLSYKIEKFAGKEKPSRGNRVMFF
jgi:hypothetical protein